MFLWVKCREMEVKKVFDADISNVSPSQDGKAIPDGPVVISPDGLFPSLFREGICY